MAFTAITTAEIQAAKPGTTTLWDKVRTNSDDHETRITTVEAATASFLPIEFTATGRLKAGNSLLPWRFTFNTDINQVRLIVPDTGEGSGGTCEIDVLHATAIAGPYTSIFSTRPSLAFGSSPGVSTNGVLTSTPFQVSGGDFIRVDIIGVQTNMRQLQVAVEYSPT